MTLSSLFQHAALGWGLLTRSLASGFCACASLAVRPSAIASRVVCWLARRDREIWSLLRACTHLVVRHVLRTLWGQAYVHSLITRHCMYLTKSRRFLASIRLLSTYVLCTRNRPQGDLMTIRELYNLCCFLLDSVMNLVSLPKCLLVPNDYAT